MISIRQAQPPALSRKSFIGMAVFMLMYLAVAVACMIQFGAPNPWGRVDVLSICYLGLAAAMGTEQSAFALRLPNSSALLGEVFGTKYDRVGNLLTALLAICELGVFIDYGHVRSAYQLETVPLRIAGLVVCTVTVFWLHWVDGRLASHFASGLESRKLVVSGPYRYLRHPRCAGLIASRVGFSLAIPSGLAWMLVVGWCLLVYRRIKLEEEHLDRIFGDSYSNYASRTSRLIPGVY